MITFMTMNDAEREQYLNLLVKFILEAGPAGTAEELAVLLEKNVPHDIKVQRRELAVRTIQIRNNFNAGMREIWGDAPSTEKVDTNPAPGLTTFRR